MGHLRHPVEQLHLARHDPPRAGGQQPLQVVAARVEEHQLEPRGRVVDLHPVGPRPEGRAVAAHRHLDRDRAGQSATSRIVGLERAVDARPAAGSEAGPWAFRPPAPAKVFAVFGPTPSSVSSPAKSGNRIVGRPATAQPSPISASQVSSSIVSMPSSAAFFALDPAPGPRPRGRSWPRRCPRPWRPAPRPAPWPRRGSSFQRAGEDDGLARDGAVGRGRVGRLDVQMRDQPVDRGALGAPAPRRRSATGRPWRRCRRCRSGRPRPRAPRRDIGVRPRLARTSALRARRPFGLRARASAACASSAARWAAAAGMARSSRRLGEGRPAR
jgi:hypothetical protein